jgi:putative ABC transport system substrate-binding protein
MKRRAFITLLVGAAAAWPLAASAQQPGMPVVGIINISSADTFASRLRAIRQGLAEIGYFEGRNVAIDYRGGDEQAGRLPALASELVRRSVNVIIAAGIPAVLAAKTATTAIPIIFNVGLDPVELGLVASLNRPGSNLTGVSNLNAELGPKQLEVLREVIPTANRFALLVNPASATFAEPLSRLLQAAARTLGLDLRVLNAGTERELGEVFAGLAQQPVGGLVIASDPFFNSRNEHVATLALRHRVPTIHQFRDFAAAGGLMSYASNLTDSYRLTGVYVGRVLKGEKPAELPVERSTKVDLVINLKTA